MAHHARLHTLQVPCTQAAPRSRLGAVRRATILDHWWEHLRVSWWVVPSAFVVGAIALSFTAQVLDERIGDEVTPAWAQFRGSTDGARSVLSTIAASMMTFSGLVFSITVLVLQLASTQFSPRVLRTFLADRRSQSFLGLFVGTFVYALLGLANVKSLDDDRITSIPVWLGILLAVASVGALIAYVHHVVQSIRATVIIQRVGDEARSSVKRLYPEGLGEDTADPDTHVELPPPVREFHYTGVSGVIQNVDEESLFALAEKANVTLGLTCQVGDFVGYQTPLIRVWGETCSLDEEELCSLVRIGGERNVTQDAAYGFRELVDIAGRVLSPSLNDPTSAVQVIDELEDLLLRLARQRFPSPFRYSERGELRLVLPRPGWDSYLRLALDEIREYGSGSMQVARRLRALLDDLSRAVPEFRRAELERQRQLLDQSVEQGFETSIERRTARSPSKQGHGSLDQEGYGA